MVIGTTNVKYPVSYLSWSNDLLLNSGFDPPPLSIFVGNKKNKIKYVNGEAFIYLKNEGSSDDIKNNLVYLLAHLTTDPALFYKKDPVYYNNLQILKSNM